MFILLKRHLGHSNQIQQRSGIDVLKSSSNFYHLFVSMSKVFPRNFSFMAQSNLFSWHLKVLEIDQKFPFYKFLSFSGTPNFI